MLEILQQRLARYRSANALEEVQALKEILQEVALYALWRAEFFEVAAFQGGTSLRILHQLPRFSEDLDFILQKPDLSFEWQHYLGPLIAGLREFGVQSDVLDKGRMEQNVRKAVLKNDSISQQLNLSFLQASSPRKITVKLEIDVQPPAGSLFQNSYLDFPLDFEICHQDLSSNFALKIHALLCRPFLKGRDWFDYAWYVSQSVQPNLDLLSAALQQHGPWKDQSIDVDLAWLNSALTAKITALDWRAAAEDVRRFLNAPQQASLRLWSPAFFLAKTAKLVN